MCSNLGERACAGSVTRSISPLPSLLFGLQLDTIAYWSLLQTRTDSPQQDRRPITPPPCVRLIITDAATGREIDCKCVSHPSPLLKNLILVVETHPRLPILVPLTIPCLSSMSIFGTRMARARSTLSALLPEAHPSQQQRHSLMRLLIQEMFLWSRIPSMSPRQIATQRTAMYRTIRCSRPTAKVSRFCGQKNVAAQVLTFWDRASRICSQWFLRCATATTIPAPPSNLSSRRTSFFSGQHSTFHKERCTCCARLHPGPQLTDEGDSDGWTAPRYVHKEPHWQFGCQCVSPK